MTLIVSARVPDGIVVAADSLATLAAHTEVLAKGRTTCPECGKQHEFEAPIQPGIAIGITSTLPFSQKLVPLLKRYAVGFFGSSQVQNRTVFSLARAFDRKAHELSGEPIGNVGRALALELHGTLSSVTDTSKIPRGSVVIGFQINGYQDDVPMTSVFKIGREVEGPQEFSGHGVTLNGDIRVVSKLWELPGISPELTSLYDAWSVQDAIDYARFLISTTATYQRFANMIPNVGGDIDIAFVGRGENFRWVQRKPLSELLLEEG